MAALLRDPPSQPEGDGAPSGSGQSPSAGARTLDELRRAARAASAVYGDATAILDLELERAGRSLGRGLWTGVRTAVLIGFITLAAVAGAVLVCVGAAGWIASSLQLGPDATRLLEGSALLACAAIAAGATWLIRRRRRAALIARLQAARQALATSAGDLADSVARAADPRPWFEQHPLAGVAAALAAGIAAGRAAGRGHARSPQPASPPDASPGQAAPPLRAEPRTSGADPAAELTALLLTLGAPLIERLFERDAPSRDADD